jgi:hypothetical protein
MAGGLHPLDNLMVRHHSERTAPSARTARRMDDCSGRSPDLRVDALFRLPGLTHSSGFVEKNSPHTVAGAVAGLTTLVAKASPHSHSPIMRAANLNPTIIVDPFQMSMRQGAFPG